MLERQRLRQDEKHQKFQNPFVAYYEIGYSHQSVIQ